MSGDSERVTGNPEIILKSWKRASSDRQTPARSGLVGSWLKTSQKIKASSILLGSSTRAGRCEPGRIPNCSDWRSSV